MSSNLDVILFPQSSTGNVPCFSTREITSDTEVVRGLLTTFGITDQSPPTDGQITHHRLAAEGASLFNVGALIRALSGFVSSMPSTHHLFFISIVSNSVYNLTGEKLLNRLIGQNAMEWILQL